MMSKQLLMTYKHDIQPNKILECKINQIKYNRYSDDVVKLK